MNIIKSIFISVLLVVNIANANANANTQSSSKEWMQYYEYKMKIRSLCYREVAEEVSLFSPPDTYNDPSLILEENYKYRNLFQMESEDLLEASLAKEPWSGDYWPYFKGILGNRFAHPKFQYTYHWKDRFDYIQRNPAMKIFKDGNQQEINWLSPSEKYDLLTNSRSTPLTDYMWSEGKAYFDEYGKVESWMGLCHGWAASALINERPIYSVDMTAFDDKTKIKFYPDEIKSLLSFAWANANYPTKFAGRRCNEKNPELDENGRIISPECNDLNPASWHIIAVNQISDLKEGFIIDATYNYEVWNFPVFAYDYSYFNVKTDSFYANVKNAMIDIEDYPNDPFKEHRHPKTKYIVGVVMSVDYTTESIAQQNGMDSEEFDQSSSSLFYYDLELDKDGNILGGEWLEDERPDFIWKPVAGATAHNYFDQYINPSEIDKDKRLNPNWNRIFEKASENGLVLYNLIEYMLKESQSN